ncbi:MAG: PilZ domain-containing protein [Proteobacteria bacterium]|nr:PilZ domain-containing protein [Pseudomonadota bacterium]MBU1640266.1 PilZ domain-containing protein [Pseudomonadota bacterium]
MDTNKERRQHHRFKSLDNIVALNNMNLGSVINMSMGGMRIKYLLRPGDSLKKSLKISLLNNEGDQYIDNLPCKVVSSTDSGPILPSTDLSTREVGVRFTNLSSSQLTKLSDFVVHRLFTLKSKE